MIIEDPSVNNLSQHGILFLHGLKIVIPLTLPHYRKELGQAQSTRFLNRKHGKLVLIHSCRKGLFFFLMA